MPVGRRFDFQLGGKGFMLARGEFSGRAWQRFGRSDAPGQRSAEDAKFGVLPDELDRPEVWNDWSGGFGQPYRRPGLENVYHWSEGFDSRWPQQLTHCINTRPAGIPNVEASENAINSFFDILPTATAEHSRIGAGDVLLLGDHELIKFPRSSNNNASVSRVATDANLLWGSRGVMFGSYYYIPNLVGSSFDRYDFTMAKTGTSGPLPGHGFAIAGNRLWRYHGPGKKRLYVQSVDAGQDPLVAANWSATIPIGNGQYDINDMIAFEDQIFVGMPDGLYVGDQSGTFFNVLSQMAAQRHAENCRTLAIYQGGVVAPYQGGIYYYQPSDFVALVRDIGPNLNSSRSPMHGKITSVFARGQWLYAGLWTGSQSHLLAGRDDGPNRPFRWHSLQKLSNAAGYGGPRPIRTIHIDGISVSSGGLRLMANHMWIGMGAAEASNANLGIHSFGLPSFDGNPLGSDLAMTLLYYVSSARIDLGAVDWDAPATPKIFRSIEVISEKLASGAQWCQVYYDVDQSGSYTLLGTIAKSPRDTLYFPSGEGSFVTGYSIEPSLRSFTFDDNVAPVYRGVILRGSLQPRSVDMVQAVARVADGLRDRQGAIMRSGATMLQELRDFGNPDAQGLQAHQLIDLMGAAHYVKLLGHPQEQEVYQQGEDYPEIAATVKMAILSYS